MQTNFRVAQPVSFLFCAYAYVSCRNRLDVKGIYGSGTRRKLFQYAAVADSVIAAFHLPVPSVALYASSCQCQCLDLSRGAEVKHYARVSVRARSNLAGDVSVPVGQQFCPAVRAATHGWCQFVHCQFVIGHSDRHDRYVPVVGIAFRVIRVATYVEEFATTFGRSFEGPAVALTALDEGFFPDQLLHCLVLAHPGASGNAPARRTCYRDFQSQRVCKVKGVAECILPLFAHKRQPFFDYLRYAESCVEIVEAGNACALHPQEVLANSFLADVAVHPMPPDPGARRLRRLCKCLQQSVLTVFVSAIAACRASTVCYGQ